MVDLVVWEYTRTFLVAVEAALVSPAVAGSRQVLWAAMTMLRAGLAHQRQVLAVAFSQRLVGLHKCRRAAWARCHLPYHSADVVSSAKGQPLPTKHCRGASICSAGL